MKYLLTITDFPEDAPDIDGVERLRLLLDEVTPQQIQEVLAVLYRTPRKPRCDRGTKRNGTPLPT